MPVYLLHFDRPVAGKARHYIGFADDVEARFAKHREGKGASFTKLAVKRGIAFHVARTWETEGRNFERRLKRRKEGPMLCPACSAEKAANLAAAQLVPAPKYQVITVDPPWQYGDEGIRGGTGKHYRTMTHEQLKALPVGDIAAPNAILCMWATSPLLKEAIDVGEAWGFTFYGVIFYWVKLNRVNHMPITGAGHTTRSGVEPCLAFVKTAGKKPRRRAADVPQLIETLEREPEALYALRGRHSAKPAEARRRIERLFGDIPRAELFARDRVKGWHVFGDEVIADLVLVINAEDGGGPRPRFKLNVSAPNFRREAEPATQLALALPIDGVQTK